MNKYKQLNEIWENKFGDAYTERKLMVHKSEGKSRATFWRNLFQMVPEVQTVLEIGCNAGINLEAIFEVNNKLQIIGIEPNKYALHKAIEISNDRYSVLNGNVYNLPRDLKSDMIFTCTVLIHISPNDLISALNNIYKASNSYILIMEYYWPTVKEIEYRGLKDVLWKQDYGAVFLQNFNVDLMETGYLDARDGFDRVTWWLFKK